MKRLTTLIFFLLFKCGLFAQKDSLVHIDNKRYFFFDPQSESYLNRDKSWGLPLIAAPWMLIDSYVYDSTLNKITQEKRSNKFGYYYYQSSDSATYCEIDLNSFGYTYKSWFGRKHDSFSYVQYSKRTMMDCLPNSSKVKTLYIEVDSSYISIETRKKMIEKHAEKLKKQNVPDRKRTYIYWLMIHFSVNGQLEKSEYALSNNMTPDEIVVIYNNP